MKWNLLSPEETSIGGYSRVEGKSDRTHSKESLV
jgi:hypothetical protein